MPIYTYTKTVNPGQLTFELNAASVGENLQLTSISVNDGDTVLDYNQALQLIEEASVTAIVNAHDSNIDNIINPPDSPLFDSVQSERQIFNFIGFNNSIAGEQQEIRTPNSNLFSGYSTTGQTLTATYFSIPINVELEKDSIFTHIANSTDVTITKTTRIFMLGTYSADSTGSRSATEGAFFLNGNIITPSVAYGYHRSRTQGENTGTSFTTLNVTVGDILTYRVREISGTAILRTPTTMRMYLEEKLDE